MRSVKPIILPWPAPELSPNARSHWGKVSAKKKVARRVAFAITKENGLYADGDGPISVKMTFRPSVMRARDLDNLMASMKASLDGIADAMRVNDSRFQPEVVIGEKHPTPHVVVEVSQ